MRPLLVLRPEPGARATAARARALDLEPVVAPLFTLAPRAWTVPEERPDALLLTSANAPRLTGPIPPAWHRLPTYAVGPATASAARDAGFTLAHVGASDGEAAARAAYTDGHRHLLRLCGEDRRPIDVQGLSVRDLVVYAAEPVETLPSRARAALEEGAVVLVHSPAAGARLSALVEEAGIARRAAALVAISEQALAAAGAGWQSGLAAGQPTDAAMLALAAPLCQEQSVRRVEQP